MCFSNCHYFWSDHWKPAYEVWEILITTWTASWWPLPRSWPSPGSTNTLPMFPQSICSGIGFHWKPWSKGWKNISFTNQSYDSLISIWTWFTQVSDLCRNTGWLGGTITCVCKKSVLPWQHLMCTSADACLEPSLVDPLWVGLIPYHIPPWPVVPLEFPYLGWWWCQPYHPAPSQPIGFDGGNSWRWILIGTAQRKTDDGRTLGEIKEDWNYSPTCTEYQRVKIWVEIFLRISWYNLNIISSAKHLVEKSVLPTGWTILFHLATIILATGLSASPNERKTTVDLQLLQVYLQISFR